MDGFSLGLIEIGAVIGACDHGSPVLAPAPPARTREGVFGSTYLEEPAAARR